MILYFHNLKFDGNFILNYLLQNGFEINDSRGNYTISTLITDRLVWYAFTVYINGRTYRFRDSSKKITGSLEQAAEAFDLKIRKGHIDYKLHRDKGYEPTKEEIAYIHNDTEILADVLQYYYDNDMPSLTNATDAMKTYKSIIGDARYKTYFPILEKEVDDFIRKSYKGGFCYVNPKFKQKDLNEVYCYDVKSMYPSRMKYSDLPYGKPIPYRGKYQKDEFYPLYIQHILVDCKLKEGYIPTVQTKTYLNIKLNYLTDTEGELIELWLTNVDLKWLLKSYEIYDIQYINGLKFKSSKELFVEYVDHFYELKEKSRGAKKQLYKIFLNSLYGKFAMQMTRRQRIPTIVNGRIAFEATDSQEVDPVYTAVASFITAYARDRLIDAIYKNIDNFVYCDTDSLHCIKPAKNIDFGTKLGEWNLEHGEYINGKPHTHVTRARYIAQKCYILGEMKGDNYIEVKKVAGAPEAVKKQINWDNFHVNFTSDASNFPKFRMMNVEGGTLLVPTTFTIKDK